VPTARRLVSSSITSRGSMRSYSWYRNLQSRRNPKLGPGSIACVDPLSRQKNFESTLIPKCPTVNFCRRFGKIRPCSFETLSRTSRAIYRHIKFCHISTGNINMLAWKLEVLFRKFAKSHILSDSKSPDYTQQTFSSSTFIFSWHLTWACCLHGFLMSIFLGSAIWLLTNRLRKLSEIYALKMWLRNVRHPSRTRRFWYHIRVLCIVVARVCRCVVMDWHTRFQDGA